MIKQVVSNNKSLFTIVAAIITLVGSIVGSVIAYVGSSAQANADLVSTLVKQNAILDKKAVSLQSKVLELEIELAQKYNAGQDIRALLDAMPFVAWAKQVVTEDEEIKFINWHINYVYSRTHNVSRAFYKDKEDWEVWPREVAAEFYKNDIYVYTRKTHKCNPESYPPDASRDISKDNPLQLNYTCKFVVKTQGIELVVGMTVSSDQIKVSPK